MPDESVPTTDSARTLVTLADPQALRDHLDFLNDAGVDYRAAGMDANGSPFLATLHGPYADTEHVLTVSPWDGEVSFREAAWCEECSAHSPLRLDSLTYPVTVVGALDLVCRLPFSHHGDCAVGGGYSPPLCGKPIARPGTSTPSTPEEGTR